VIAAQYEILLPADYDMDIIRDRVATRGGAMDGHPGLGLKAYLVRDIADGSPVNAYAPFYLWNSEQALAGFHWGGQGFAGIVRDFGRPAVRTWLGGGFHRGPAFGAMPAWAVKTLTPLPADADPQEAAGHAAAAALARAGAEADLHSLAWGIDPARWEQVTFTLNRTRPSGTGGGVAYRVLHLSAPGIDELG
jgi:hypothetical protein